jgi:hypothetical protein
MDHVSAQLSAVQYAELLDIVSECPGDADNTVVTSAILGFLESNFAPAHLSHWHPTGLGGSALLAGKSGVELCLVHHSRTRRVPAGVMGGGSGSGAGAGIDGGVVATQSVEIASAVVLQPGVANCPIDANVSTDHLALASGNAHQGVGIAVGAVSGVGAGEDSASVHGGGAGGGTGNNGAGGGAGSDGPGGSGNDSDETSAGDSSEDEEELELMPALAEALVMDAVVWGVRAPTRAIHAHAAGIIQHAGALYMEAQIVGDFSRKRRTWRLGFRDGKVLRRQLEDIMIASGGSDGPSVNSASSNEEDGPSAGELLAGLQRALESQSRSERNLQRERDANAKQLADNQRQMAEMQRQSQDALAASRQVHVDSNASQAVDLRELLAAVVGANPVVQKNALNADGESDKQRISLNTQNTDFRLLDSVQHYEAVVTYHHYHGLLWAKWGNLTVDSAADILLMIGHTHAYTNAVTLTSSDDLLKLCGSTCWGVAGSGRSLSPPVPLVVSLFYRIENGRKSGKSKTQFAIDPLYVPEEGGTRREGKKIAEDNGREVLLKHVKLVGIVNLFDSPENAQQTWGKLKPVLQRRLDAVELQLTTLLHGRTEIGLPRPQEDIRWLLAATEILSLQLLYDAASALHRKRSSLNGGNGGIYGAKGLIARFLQEHVQPVLDHVDTDASIGGRSARRTVLFCNYLRGLQLITKELEETDTFNASAILAHGSTAGCGSLPARRLGQTRLSLGGSASSPDSALDGVDAGGGGTRGVQFGVGDLSLHTSLRFGATADRAVVAAKAKQLEESHPRQLSCYQLRPPEGPYVTFAETVVSQSRHDTQSLPRGAQNGSPRGAPLRIVHRSSVLPGDLGQGTTGVTETESVSTTWLADPRPTSAPTDPTLSADQLKMLAQLGRGRAQDPSPYNHGSSAPSRLSDQAPLNELDVGNAHRLLINLTTAVGVGDELSSVAMSVIERMLRRPGRAVRGLVRFLQFGTQRILWTGRTSSAPMPDIRLEMTTPATVSSAPGLLSQSGVGSSEDAAIPSSETVCDSEGHAGDVALDLIDLRTAPLVRRGNDGNGNCLFIAFEQLLSIAQERCMRDLNGKAMRMEIVAQQEDMIQGFRAEGLDSATIDRMWCTSKGGTAAGKLVHMRQLTRLGGHMEIVAFAALHRVNVRVHQAEGGDYRMTICPEDGAHDRTLDLAYFKVDGGYHYEMLSLAGKLPLLPCLSPPVANVGPGTYIASVGVLGPVCVQDGCLGPCSQCHSGLQCLFECRPLGTAIHSQQPNEHTRGYYVALMQEGPEVAPASRTVTYTVDLGLEEALAQVSSRLADYAFALRSVGITTVADLEKAWPAQLLSAFFIIKAPHLLQMLLVNMVYPCLAPDLFIISVPLDLGGTAEFEGEVVDVHGPLRLESLHGVNKAQRGCPLGLGDTHKSRMGYTCQLRVKFVTAEWIDDHEHLGPGHLVFTAEAASGAETLLLNVTRQACDVLQKIVGCPAIHTLLVVGGDRHWRGACVLGAVLVALRAVETWDQALGLMKQQSPPGGEIHVTPSGNALMALLVTALRQDPAELVRLLSTKEATRFEVAAHKIQIGAGPAYAVTAKLDRTMIFRLRADGERVFTASCGDDISLRRSCLLLQLWYPNSGEQATMARMTPTSKLFAPEGVWIRRDDPNGRAPAGVAKRSRSMETDSVGGSGGSTPPQKKRCDDGTSRPQLVIPACLRTVGGGDPPPLPAQTNVDESAVKVGGADDDMSDGSTCTVPYSPPCGVSDGVAGGGGASGGGTGEGGADDSMAGDTDAYGPQNSIMTQRGRATPEPRVPGAAALNEELRRQMALHFSREPTLAELNDERRRRAHLAYGQEHGYSPLSPALTPPQSPIVEPVFDDEQAPPTGDVGAGGGDADEGAAGGAGGGNVGDGDAGEGDAGGGAIGDAGVGDTGDDADGAAAGSVLYATHLVRFKVLGKREYELERGDMVAALPPNGLFGVRFDDIAEDSTSMPRRQITDMVVTALGQLLQGTTHIVACVCARGINRSMLGYALMLSALGVVDEMEGALELARVHKPDVRIINAWSDPAAELLYAVSRIRRGLPCESSRGRSSRSRPVFNEESLACAAQIVTAAAGARAFLTDATGGFGLSGTELLEKQTPYTYLEIQIPLLVAPVVAHQANAGAGAGTGAGAHDGADADAGIGDGLGSGGNKGTHDQVVVGSLPYIDPPSIGVHANPVLSAEQMRKLAQLGRGRVQDPSPFNQDDADPNGDAADGGEVAPDTGVPNSVASCGEYVNGRDYASALYRMLPRLVDGTVQSVPSHNADTGAHTHTFTVRFGPPTDRRSLRQVSNSIESAKAAKHRAAHGLLQLAPYLVALLRTVPLDAVPLRLACPPGAMVVLREELGRVFGSRLLITVDTLGAPQDYRARVTVQLGLVYPGAKVMTVYGAACSSKVGARDALAAKVLPLLAQRTSELGRPLPKCKGCNHTLVPEHNLWQHGGAVVVFPAQAIFDTCDFVPRVAPNVIQSHQGTEYDDGWFACKACNGVVAVHHTWHLGQLGYAVLGGPHSVVDKSCARVYFALPLTSAGTYFTLPHLPHSAPRVVTSGTALGVTAAVALDGAWQGSATAGEQYELAVAAIETSESDTGSDPESLPDLDACDPVMPGDEKYEHYYAADMAYYASAHAAATRAVPSTAADARAEESFLVDHDYKADLRLYAGAQGRWVFYIRVGPRKADIEVHAEGGKGFGRVVTQCGSDAASYPESEQRCAALMMRKLRREIHPGGGDDITTAFIACRDAATIAASAARAAADAVHGMGTSLRLVMAVSGSDESSDGTDDDGGGGASGCDEGSAVGGNGVGNDGSGRQGSRATSVHGVFTSGDGAGGWCADDEAVDAGGKLTVTHDAALTLEPCIPVSPLQGRVSPEVALVLGVRSEPIPAEVVVTGTSGPLSGGEGGAVAGQDGAYAGAWIDGVHTEAMPIVVLPPPLLDDGELVYRHMTLAFDDVAPEGEYPPDLCRHRQLLEALTPDERATRSLTLEKLAPGRFAWLPIGIMPHLFSFLYDPHSIRGGPHLWELTRSHGGVKDLVDAAMLRRLQEHVTTVVGGVTHRVYTTRPRLLPAGEDLASRARGCSPDLLSDVGGAPAIFARYFRHYVDTQTMGLLQDSWYAEPRDAAPAMAVGAPAYGSTLLHEGTMGLGDEDARGKTSTLQVNVTTVASQLVALARLASSKDWRPTFLEGTNVVKHKVDGVARFGISYPAQQKGEFCMVSGLRRLGGKVVAGLECGQKTRLPTGTTPSTCHAVRRWDALHQLLEILVVYDSDLKISNMAAMEEMMGIVLATHGRLRDDEVLVVTVTICSWRPSGKAYAHRTALLLDAHGSLYYDAVSLVESAHVKTSSDQLVPYLERRMRSAGLLFYATRGEADTTRQGQGGEDTDCCNNLTTVAVCAAAFTGVAGVLAVLRCIQMLGPDTLLQVAKVGLGMLWSCADVMHAKRVDSEGEPMPHSIVDAHRREALEPIVAEVHAEIRAALHAIVHPSGGLQTAKCNFALTYDGFNIEFYDLGQPFHYVHSPPLARLATLVLRGVTRVELQAWEGDNRLHQWTSEVSPAGLRVLSEKRLSTGGAGGDDLRWGSSSVGELYGRMMNGNIKMRDAVKAAQGTGLTHGEATEVMNSPDAAEAYHRHSSFNKPIDMKHHPLRPAVICVSGECVGVASDFDSIEQAARGAGVSFRVVSITEKDPKLRRIAMGSFHHQEPPLRAELCGTFTGTTPTEFALVTYACPPCTMSQTNSNGDSLGHPVGDPRECFTPLAARVLKAQPAIMVIENAWSSNRQDGIGFLCRVADVIHGGHVSVTIRGVDAGVPISMARSFTILGNSVVAPYLAALKARIEDYERTKPRPLSYYWQNDEYSEIFVVGSTMRFEQHPPTQGCDDAPTAMGFMMKGDVIFAVVYDGEGARTTFKRPTRSTSRAASLGIYLYRGKLWILTLLGLAHAMGIAPSRIPLIQSRRGVVDAVDTTGSLTSLEALRALCNTVPRVMPFLVLQPVFELLRDHPEFEHKTRMLSPLPHHLRTMVAPHLSRIQQPDRVCRHPLHGPVIVEHLPYPVLPQPTCGLVGDDVLGLLGVIQTGFFQPSYAATAQTELARELLGSRTTILPPTGADKMTCAFLVAGFIGFDSEDLVSLRLALRSNWLVYQLHYIGNTDEGHLKARRFFSELQESKGRRCGLAIRTESALGYGDSVDALVTTGTLTDASLRETRGTANAPGGGDAGGTLFTHLASPPKVMALSPRSFPVKVLEHVSLRRTDTGPHAYDNLVDGIRVLAPEGPGEWPLDFMVADGRLHSQRTGRVFGRHLLKSELLSLYGVLDEGLASAVLRPGLDREQLRQRLLVTLPPLMNAALALRAHQFLSPMTQDAALNVANGYGGSTAGAAPSQLTCDGEKCDLRELEGGAYELHVLQKAATFSQDGCLYRLRPGITVQRVCDRRQGLLPAGTSGVTEGGSVTVLDFSRQPLAGVRPPRRSVQEPSPRC